MGLGNIIKKAVEIGTDFAGEAIKVGVSLAEEKGIIKSQEVIAAEKAEAERLAAEETRRKQEIEEQIKQEKIAEILKPSCENGDCLWHNGRFYFTCDSSVKCQRKDVTTKKWAFLSEPFLWPYLKRYEYISKMTENKSDEMLELINDFVSEQMPAFSGFVGLLSWNFESYGMTFDNPMFSLLWHLKDKNIKLTYHMMECLDRKHLSPIFLNLDLEFYKNPSLYSRSDAEFDYAVRLFELIENPEQCVKYNLNLELIDKNALYDSDGNIKPTGLGGPEAGFYGDTLYNTLESWSK